MAFMRYFYTSDPTPNIDFPVGMGAPNHRDDVMLVQALMISAVIYANQDTNRSVDISLSGFHVDGLYGPRTQKALGELAARNGYAFTNRSNGRGWIMPLRSQAGLLYDSHDAMQYLAWHAVLSQWYGGEDSPPGSGYSDADRGVPLSSLPGFEMYALDMPPELRHALMRPRKVARYYAQAHRGHASSKGHRHGSKHDGGLIDL